MRAAYLIRGVLGRLTIDTVGVATATEALVAVQHFRATPRLIVTVFDRTGAVVDEQVLQWRARCEDVPPSLSPRMCLRAHGKG